jgi:triacylglycerol lipase
MASITWDDLLRPGDATDFFTRMTMPPFEPTATAFSVANAVWLAELSRLVYRRGADEGGPPPQPSRESFLASAKLREVRAFRSHLTDTQAMLVESEGTPTFAALIFRGTEQRPRDFVTDLSVGVKVLAPGKPGAHMGFEAALESVWHAIDEELRRITSPVYYTGHSLGAALATLAAARRAPWAVYTFGSPLVGNAEFGVTLERVPIYRVVDDADAVTLVPPDTFGFRHIGTVTQLKAPPSTFTFADFLASFTRPKKPLADHAPVAYVDRIGTLLANGASRPTV